MLMESSVELAGTGPCCWRVVLSWLVLVHAAGE